MPSDTNTTPAQVQVAMSGLNAAEYPNTTISTDNEGLTIWDGEPAAYDHWQCLNEFIEEVGTLVLPTASPTGVNVAVDYSSVMVMLVQRWAAKRTGAPPRFPPKVVYIESTSSLVQSTDANWIYVGGSSPQVRELGIAPDGVSIVYEATGIHIFQALDASLVNYFSPVIPTLDPVQTFTARKWANNNNPPPSSVAIQNYAAGVVPGITGVASPNGSLGGTGGGTMFPPSIPASTPTTPNPFSVPPYPGTTSPLGSNSLGGGS